jgi:broad specificity phosphatase PhoE
MLADRLGRAGVTRIIVTDLKRTQQTAAPLAARLGITPEIIATTVPGHSDSVAATVLHHRGESILVVGHSVTVPAIIEALGGPKFPTICDSQYSDLFVVHISDAGATRVEHLHYGPADALNAACALP